MIHMEKEPAAEAWKPFPTWAIGHNQIISFKKKKSHVMQT